MASPATARSADYFASRPLPRTRTSGSGLGGSPGSPRTPLAGRRISSQLGSPGSLAREPEEVVVYELHPRSLSAGFAGENKPRCVHRFGYQTGDGRRVGDFREFLSGQDLFAQASPHSASWAAPYELFQADIRHLDLALVSDRLERALRAVHAGFLQLDTSKSRKAVLALPSLFPAPVLEAVLRVLFTHHAQPPTITLLTTPILSCVSAGLRNALVVEIGWEETVVTAVGEHKPVAERRSVRGGKSLVREMAGLLSEAHGGKAISFRFAEDVTRRMAWCKSREATGETGSVTIPSPDETSRGLTILYSDLAKPAEEAFIQPPTDDHDLSLPLLMFNTLLALPVDLRALCISRIVITGPNSRIPGLRPRLLHELSTLVDKRGWDAVENYGSAKDPLPRRLKSLQLDTDPPTLPATTQSGANGSTIPPRDRQHDDASDRLSQQVFHASTKSKEIVVKGVVRGVETLGAWSGASLVASLRVKGTVEVDREEFLGGVWREKGLP